MLKVEKFQDCTCMRLYSVKQNIEGDANLHHHPGIGLRAFDLALKDFSLISLFSNFVND